MPPVKTRECTEVFFDIPKEGDIVEFKCRELTKTDTLNIKPFYSDKSLSAKKVLENLEIKLKYYEQLKKGLLTKREPVMKKRVRVEWKDKVNRKRKFIRICLENYPEKSMREISRLAKVSLATVNKVKKDIQVFGDYSRYKYNFLKTEEELEQLNETINEVEDSFSSLTDLKRLNPTFSKKYLGKELHRRGFRYLMLPRRIKNPKPQMINSTKVCQVVSHLSQALSNSHVEALYIDEIKFPLYQTSTHSWTRKKSEDRVVYNRRLAEETQLTVIALCSIERFIAVQVFQREITGVDFLYFLKTALARLPNNVKYTILADNATWHHSQKVSESEVSKFLYFNEPRHFQLNIIENAFSFIRNSFRKRNLTEASLIEEGSCLLSIFFDPQNIERFKGVLRNHLRQLISFYNRHVVRSEIQNLNQPLELVNTLD